MLIFSRAGRYGGDGYGAHIGHTESQQLLEANVADESSYCRLEWNKFHEIDADVI